MSVTTYAELLTQVADDLDRSDLTSVIPDFVLMFESLCNYGDGDIGFSALRTRDMESTGTGTPDANGDITLSGNVLDIRRVTYKSDPRVTLSYVSPESLDEMYGTTATGDPAVYTVIGTTLSIRPVGTSDVEYIYLTKIPALVDNSTNWLLTASPQAYRYGTLFYAKIYLEDPEGAAAMLALAKSALTGLNAVNLWNRSGSYQMRGAAVAW